MQGNGPIRIVEKLWGTELWYANNEYYCLKRLILQPGFSCSLHYHKLKRETFVVQRGECWLRINNEIRLMIEDSWTEIAPKTTHCFWNDSLYECVITEVSTFHDDLDVVRIEESRKLTEDEK